VEEDADFRYPGAELRDDVPRDLTPVASASTIDRGRFASASRRAEMPATAPPTGSPAMIFDSVPLAPPDSILGLNEAFRQDPNPAKINLSVGVYKDAGGNTPIMRSVKRAEERLLREEKTKDYIAIQGAANYTRHVQELLFPAGHEVLSGARLATVQTPGGTAALRVAADFLQKVMPKSRVWMSDPTWPNHPSIFQAAGREIRTYPYFDALTNDLNFPAMVAALREIPEGDVVLLHDNHHNRRSTVPNAWCRSASGGARAAALVGATRGWAREFVRTRQDFDARAGRLLVASSLKNFDCRTPGRDGHIGQEPAVSPRGRCIRCSNRRRTGGHCLDHSRRPRSPRRMGNRSPRNPRTHQRDENPLRGDPREMRREARLLVHHPAARHVFVLGTDARAGPQAA
jgi:hypothetical protein